MQMTPDKKKNKLYIVVPCYNEEQVLGETSKRLKIKCENLIQKGQISKDSKIVFVDDGSKDRTWKMISELHETDSIVFRSKAIKKQRTSKCIISRSYDGIRTCGYGNINGRRSSG